MLLKVVYFRQSGISMSFTRVNLQSTRERDREIYKSAEQFRPMGRVRVFFSALVLLFGAFMYYIAMHYIPVLAKPHGTVRIATESQILPSGTSEFEIGEASTLEKLMGPYYKLFSLDRSYMRAGESIKIKYEIPETATVNLDIVQCRRLWVIEIFHCGVVSQFNTQKDSPRGMATYALGQPGFYHFRHEVLGLSDGETYRLVWERVKDNPRKTQAMVK